MGATRTESQGALILGEKKVKKAGKITRLQRA